MVNLRDLMLESVKDKYFQNVLSPSLIIQPSSFEPKMMGEPESKISAWAPLEERSYTLSLGETHLYRELSKEQFEKYKKIHEKGGLEKIEEAYDKEMAQTMKNIKGSIPSETSENIPTYNQSGDIIGY